MTDAPSSDAPTRRPTGPDAGPEVVTEGSGSHEQTADRAELDLTLSATARTRADAVRELARRTSAVAALLDGPGVRVRHRRFWVRNEWRGRRLSGCRAGEDIALQVTDPTRLDELLAGLVDAEPTALDGPRWTLADPAAAVLEAQRAAVADARRRAEGYAAALGARLGPLRLLTESGAAVPYAVAARAFGAESRAALSGTEVRELNLEPEPVQITVRCTTRWVLITES